MNSVIDHQTGIANFVNQEKIDLYYETISVFKNEYQWCDFLQIFGDKLFPYDILPSDKCNISQQKREILNYYYEKYNKNKQRILRFV